MSFQFMVAGKKLILTNKEELNSGEANISDCMFTFDTSWSGYTKTAVFYSNATAKKWVVLENDACIIPWENLVSFGMLYVGLVGVKGDQVITTNYEMYPIMEGADYSSAPLPTEDIYLQVIGIMQQQAVDASTATQKAAEANSSAEAAAESEAYSYNSEVNSKASETASKNSENAAKQSETNAAQYASTAEEQAGISTDKANEVKNLITKTPYVGANGNWYEWNTETSQYVDTGTHAKGDKGDTFTYSDMTAENKTDLLNIGGGQWEQEFADKYAELETEYATDLTKVKTDLAQIANTPRLSMQYAISKISSRNLAGAGAQYIFYCFYQVYDIQMKTTGAVYALEYPLSGMTSVRVFRSFDGGDTWAVVCSLPCNVANGERLEQLFVEPFNETLVILKNNNINASTKDYSVVTYNTSAQQLGILNIGNRYWHAAAHNIDCTLNKSGQRQIMFAEYGNDTASSVRVWKTIDNGANWTNVFEKTANNNVSESGAVRHFHCLQVDPFTGDWWLGSGDTDNQCYIWRSQDDGSGWAELFKGDQTCRTLSFVFEEGSIFYAMDSPMANVPSKIYKIDRSTLLRSEIGVVNDGLPVYSLTKTFLPKGFLIFPNYEINASKKSDDIAIQWYDTERNKLYTVAQVSTRGITTAEGNIGFLEASRAQCKFTGNIFLTVSPNLSKKKYGMDVPSTIHSNVLKCKITE